MEINLLPIINADGKVLPVDTELDVSAEQMQGVIFLSPLHISGSFTNIGGSIELRARVSGRVQYECDRCCEKYEDSIDFELAELLKKETSETENDGNPDTLYFTGNSVELDEIVLNNVFMNLPAKHLCREDCKGLCPVCGKNLNSGDCGCDTRTADPRFDALDHFFD